MIAVIISAIVSIWITLDAIDRHMAARKEVGRE